MFAPDLSPPFPVTANPVSLVTPSSWVCGMWAHETAGVALVNSPVPGSKTNVACEYGAATDHYMVLKSDPMERSKNRTCS